MQALECALTEGSPVCLGTGEHPKGSAKETHSLVDAQAEQRIGVI